MCLGRLSGKFCWYMPRSEGDWHWERAKRRKAGFTNRTLVFVKFHQYESNRGLSNFVDFVRVKEDGQLARHVYGCYDYGQFQVINPQPRMKIDIDILRLR